MPLVSEVVHPRGLKFVNQRKVVMLRDNEHLSWGDIAERVVNLAGEPSNRETVKRVYNRFSKPKGRCSYGYGRCGRARWKLTADIQTWLVRRLCAERKTTIVTSTSLQQDLAHEKGVVVSASAIRKVLKDKGYRWLPRAQKRLYNADARKDRLKFARYVDRLSAAELRERLSLSMDGCVLTVPPADPTERLNFCRHGETHMWRQPGEAASPDLAGEDPYADQIPLKRAIPLWGGISEGGFAEVVVHKYKKLSVDE